MSRTCSGVGRKRGAAAAGAARGNHRHGARPHLGLLLAGKAHLRIAPHLPRAHRPREQVKIPGQVDQRDQQCRDVGMFERGADRRMVGVDGAMVDLDGINVKEPGLPGPRAWPCPRGAGSVLISGAGIA